MLNRIRMMASARYGLSVERKDMSRVRDRELCHDAFMKLTMRKRRFIPLLSTYELVALLAREYCRYVDVHRKIMEGERFPDRDSTI